MSNLEMKEGEGVRVNIHTMSLKCGFIWTAPVLRDSYHNSRVSHERLITLVYHNNAVHKGNERCSP